MTDASELKQPVARPAGSADIQEKIQELKGKRKKLEEAGGLDRIKTQHEKGKLTARERISKLVDAGSFQEIDAFMTHRHSDFGMADQSFLGDGIVTGFAKINGKRVGLYAQDFTTLGGTFSEVHGIKVGKIMDLACDAGVPVIAMNDSGGARIQEGVYSLNAYGELFWRNTQASGVVPQISMILGPCAGGAVYSPGLTDFIVMTKDISQMFITGPEVIKSVTGEQVDFETLGGGSTHTAVSGVAHFLGENEEDTFAIVKALLGYLPSNNSEPAPYIIPTDVPDRRDADLNHIVPVNPNEPYDMKDVINRVFDLGSFLEVHQNFAKNAVVGFARLHGQVVGVVGQQPMEMAGMLDINASDKIARFVRFCDAFNIPLITFVDCPGFMPGVNQEHGGIIRHGAKIVYSYSEATVPKISIVTRKAYGGAYLAMSSKSLHADLAFAWPTAEIAVMGAEGAVNILYRKQLQNKENAVEIRQQLVAEYRNKFGTPYLAANNGFIDDVLIPDETRPRLIASLELLRDKRVHTFPKKHGTMPL